MMSRRLWSQTVAVATGEGVLTRRPGSGAYRRDLAEAALAGLTAEGLDVWGDTYQPRRVQITPGGHRDGPAQMKRRSASAGQIVLYFPGMRE